MKEAGAPGPLLGPVFGLGPCLKASSAHVGKCHRADDRLKLAKLAGNVGYRYGIDARSSDGG